MRTEAPAELERRRQQSLLRDYSFVNELGDSFVPNDVKKRAAPTWHNYGLSSTKRSRKEVAKNQVYRSCKIRIRPYPCHTHLLHNLFLCHTTAYNLALRWVQENQQQLLAEKQRRKEERARERESQPLEGEGEGEGQGEGEGDSSSEEEEEEEERAPAPRAERKKVKAAARQPKPKKVLEAQAVSTDALRELGCPIDTWSQGHRLHLPACDMSA